MIDNGLLGFPFGCYFGLVFEACQYPRMHTYELVNESWWKKYVRFLVTVGLCIPVLAIGLIPGEFNIYLMMLVKRFIPTFGSGFIIYGLSDWVNKKINLLQFEPENQQIFYGNDAELALQSLTTYT